MLSPRWQRTIRHWSEIWLRFWVHEFTLGSYVLFLILFYLVYASSQRTSIWALNPIWKTADATGGYYWQLNYSGARYEIHKVQLNTLIQLSRRYCMICWLVIIGWGSSFTALWGYTGFTTLHGIQDGALRACLLELPKFASTIGMIAEVPTSIFSRCRKHCLHIRDSASFSISIIIFGIFLELVTNAFQSRYFKHSEIFFPNYVFSLDALKCCILFLYVLIHLASCTAVIWDAHRNSWANFTVP